MTLDLKIRCRRWKALPDSALDQGQAQRSARNEQCGSGKYGTAHAPSIFPKLPHGLYMRRQKTNQRSGFKDCKEANSGPSQEVFFGWRGNEEDGAKQGVLLLLLCVLRNWQGNERSPRLTKEVSKNKSNREFLLISYFLLFSFAWSSKHVSDAPVLKI